MWGRSEYEDGVEPYKTAGSGAPSPAWLPGCESTAWPPTASSSTGSSINRGRRHSTASDSGDTGIGTSCSDSVEDHSSSSGTLSFQPLRPHGCIPTAHVMPSPSSSKLDASSSRGPWSTSQPTTPVNGPLDMKDPRPVRRWSSLTRLAGSEKTSMRGVIGSRVEAHGSLDRGLQYSSRLGSLQHSLETFRLDSSPGSHTFSPGAESCYRYEPSATLESGVTSPLKPSTLDLTFSALPESRTPVTPLHTPGQRSTSLGHKSVGGSPIQPAVRTQMWLSEQMHSNPVEYRSGQDPCGGSPWLQEQQRERLRQEAEFAQMLSGTALPVNTLVKIKEGLLRQRELEIDRQKQQILQLHARIRENELRVQQVLQNQRGRSEDAYLLKATDSPFDGPRLPVQLPNGMGPLCCENGELGRRMAAAELEVIHLNELLKQNTQKYTEDIKKLEEKMKTRDRYISSLKKKCQRESEQNQEKQQRIETLEKYLADLPSLDEVQTQAQQLEEVRGEAQTLQDKASQLEQSLAESKALLKEKEALIESQAQREQELVATVQSLQEKVEKCLEDGVRLPMMDLKRLERDNASLREQHTQSSKLLDNQKNQIEKLSLELAAMEKRLQTEQGVSQELRSQLQEKDETLEALSKATQEKQRWLEEGMSGLDVGPLLKEMSLCLLDLKALCSILTQRAQGKEPNLALLLGIKSMNCAGEDTEKPLRADSLQAELSEVCRLRKEIDELRTAISDRYAQDMGDNCITQ
ncbi:centrosomal protein of 85 kDa-like isoform X2 [Scleropages formosus]|uniref:centrosomal protein of 85 kDa-like isoform X2 n=1 Tax=Scleropages formosus TaxID=113540 RepID=UPI000878F021|nr:centrosomal protein of 85 kDa-like isoform X2 [Scleropages formosus]